mmetsp:Transcript_29291/g.73473  ORF Transcript_29291/g.73473 Transcript_29291/m.73473 type:complete len:287 (+) Transcript_29291:527-1387(+)
MARAVKRADRRRQHVKVLDDHLVFAVRDAAAAQGAAEAGLADNAIADLHVGHHVRAVQADLLPEQGALRLARPVDAHGRVAQAVAVLVARLHLGGAAVQAAETGGAAADAVRAGSRRRSAAVGASQLVAQLPRPAGFAFAAPRLLGAAPVAGAAVGAGGGGVAQLRRGGAAHGAAAGQHHAAAALRASRPVAAVAAGTGAVHAQLQPPLGRAPLPEAHGRRCSCPFGQLEAPAVRPVVLHAGGAGHRQPVHAILRQPIAGDDHLAGGVVIGGGLAVHGRLPDGYCS